MKMMRRGLAFGMAFFVILAVPRSRCEEPEDRQHLVDIEAKITQIRASIDQQDEREKSELVQVEQIEMVEGLLSQQTQILDRAVAEQSMRVKDAETRMKALQEDFDIKKAALKKRLVALYKMGEMSYARLLLSVKSAANLATAYAYISKLVQGDQLKVQAYHESLSALTVERDTLGKKIVELTELKAANSAKQVELNTEHRNKERAIAAIRSEKARYLQAISELETAAQELRKLLNELPPNAESLSIGRFKGSIRWPHPGKVTTGFGLHKHPLFNTITVQNGIDIDAQYNDQVQSIFDGKVVYADWFRGYGNLVILDHGDKYFSLYAHLSRFSVTLGETVVTGQLVGYVGDTGSLKGAYLYFELRQGEKPLNPLDWLEKKRHVG